MGVGGGGDADLKYLIWRQAKPTQLLSQLLEPRQIEGTSGEVLAQVFSDATLAHRRSAALFHGPLDTAAA